MRLQVSGAGEGGIAFAGGMKSLLWHGNSLFGLHRMPREHMIGGLQGREHADRRIRRGYGVGD